MTVNRSAPAGAVVPILIYEDLAEAVEWLCGAFGFSERLRAERDGVVGHAQLVVGDGAVILGRRGGPFQSPGDGPSQYVLAHVDDVDRHFETARRAGASVVQGPADMPFGERQCTVRDFAGHWWTFSQHIADVAPEQWGAKEAQNR